MMFTISIWVLAAFGLYDAAAAAFLTYLYLILD